MTKNNSLLCATSNSEKLEIGRRAFAKHGITLEQVVIDIDEIQSEDPEVILRDKAEKAFAAVGKPVLVSDDSWAVPALNGFPGAYMKSMNHWLEPQDFINLMSGKKDRSIYLDQRLAYIDEHQTVTFDTRISGVIVDKPRGNTGPPIMRVVELEDDGMTIAELFDNGAAHDNKRDAWNEAAAWYAKTHKN